MTLETEQGILRPHATAVVGHLDEGPPRILHHHIHPRGASINGIFHQLLHNRCRTLYDLARCNLVGNRLRQQMNPAHGHGNLDMTNNSTNRMKAKIHNRFNGTR